MLITYPVTPTSGRRADFPLSLESAGTAPANVRLGEASPLD